MLASLGCGNPTAVAELRAGETVLDLGSGGGIDVILSASGSGPPGKAFGLDMTDEMLELARRNAARSGRRQRRVPEGLHRGGAAAGRQRRRRHLELRDQPVGRQAEGVRRDASRAAARRADRRQRHRGGGRPDAGAARRARQLRRVHRRRALVRRVRRASSGARASRTSGSSRRTRSADGMFSAIVRARRSVTSTTGRTFPRCCSSASTTRAAARWRPRCSRHTPGTGSACGPPGARPANRSTRPWPPRWPRSGSTSRRRGLACSPTTRSARRTWSSRWAAATRVRSSPAGDTSTGSWPTPSVVPSSRSARSATRSIAGASAPAGARPERGLGLGPFR